MNQETLYPKSAAPRLVGDGRETCSTGAPEGERGADVVVEEGPHPKRLRRHIAEVCYCVGASDPHVHFEDFDIGPIGSEQPRCIQADCEDLPPHAHHEPRHPDDGEPDGEALDPPPRLRDGYCIRHNEPACPSCLTYSLSECRNTIDTLRLTLASVQRERDEAQLSASSWRGEALGAIERSGFKDATSVIAVVGELVCERDSARAEAREAHSELDAASMQEGRLADRVRMYRAEVGRINEDRSAPRAELGETVRRAEGAERALNEGCGSIIHSQLRRERDAAREEAKLASRERDEARAGRENWREACRKAEAEGRSAGDTLEAAIKRERAENARIFNVLTEKERRIEEALSGIRSSAAYQHGDQMLRRLELTLTTANLDAVQTVSP